MTDYDTTIGATSTSTSAPTTSEPAAGRAAQLSPAGDTLGGSGLQTAHGNTTIADSVVAKIAGMAAREIPGVHSMGSGTARAIGAVRSRIPGQSTQASAGQGVSVEVGETQAAVDLQILVEYGVPIADLAKAVRRNVITAIERMTGLEVVEVNIHVNDVHIPGAEDTPPEPTRVQ